MLEEAALMPGERWRAPAITGYLGIPFAKWPNPERVEVIFIHRLRCNPFRVVPFAAVVLG